MNPVSPPRMETGKPVFLALQPAHRSPQLDWGEVPHTSSGRVTPLKATTEEAAWGGCTKEQGRARGSWTQPGSLPSAFPRSRRAYDPTQGVGTGDFALPTPSVPISSWFLRGQRHLVLHPGWLRLLPAQPLRQGCPAVPLQLTALP